DLWPRAHSVSPGRARRQPQFRPDRVRPIDPRPRRGDADDPRSDRQRPPQDHRLGLSHSRPSPRGRRAPPSPTPHTAGEETDTMTTMNAEDQQATADPVDVDDLAATDDAPLVPELDPEAALLCALLHTTDEPEARHTTDYLQFGDRINPRYGALPHLTADLINPGAPHHPPRALAAFTRAGRVGRHRA